MLSVQKIYLFSIENRILIRRAIIRTRRLAKKIWTGSLRDILSISGRLTVITSEVTSTLYFVSLRRYQCDNRLANSLDYQRYLGNEPARLLLGGPRKGRKSSLISKGFSQFQDRLAALCNRVNYRHRYHLPVCCQSVCCSICLFMDSSISTPAFLCPHTTPLKTPARKAGGWWTPVSLQFPKL